MLAAASLNVPFCLYCRVTGVTFSRKSNQKASDTSLRPNPLVGPNPAQGRLWASGLREPFGLSSPLGAQAHPPKIARFWCGVARTAPNVRFMALPLLVDLSGVRPDPPQNRAGDLSCAPSVAVVSGLEVAVLSPCRRGMGLRSLLVVCTRNRPPHQASGQLGTVARFESLIRTVPFRQRRNCLTALRASSPCQGEANALLDLPMLPICRVGNERSSLASP